MTDLPKIVRVPGTMSGDLIIEGTRVRPETVLLEILDGKPEVNVMQTYPTLPSGSVQAVIEWARERLRLFETGGYDVNERGMEAPKGMKGDRKEATFTSIDGQEWVMQRVAGETQAEFEERLRLFEDLSRSNGGRIPIAVTPGDLPKSALEKLRKQADEYPDAQIEIVDGTDTYAEIAAMMTATCSLDEILAQHPGADIEAVMRWHHERTGDDLENTHAAGEWRERG